MNKQLRPSDLSRTKSDRLRLSALPTIDRLTGRLLPALLAAIGVGLLGIVAVILYRVLA
jgi:hypothetical protein